MTSRLGPRFAAEATFILAVAAVAGLLSLGWVGVVVVMVAAWLAVAVVEVSMSRADDDDTRSRQEPEAEPEVPAEPLVAEPGEPPPVEPAPAPPESDERDRDVPVADLEPLPERVVFPLDPEGERRERESGSDLGEPGAEPDSPPAQEPEPRPPRLEAAPSPPAARFNLWDLETRARAEVGKDPGRDEERAYLLIYLRDVADVDGTIPPEFHQLVRQSFADIVEDDPS